MITAATETAPIIRGFADTFIELPISPRMRLDRVEAIMDGIAFGATDCALPMLWALGYEASGGRYGYGHGATYKKTKRAVVPIDAFVVYTDSETYCNPECHPYQALEDYRRKTGIPAKLIIVGMTATEVTIGDTDDAGTLNVCGFDTNTPSALADFIRKEL